MLDDRYQKTEAGRAEIKDRSLAELSRGGRNLLLMIDATRTAREWLAMVRGSAEADLALLVSGGLVAPLPAAAPMASRPAVSPLPYAELYRYLTGNARKYLGLIKGYRMVLDVEKCSDLAAMQALAERFMDEVEREHGEAAAEQVRQSLYPIS